MRKILLNWHAGSTFGWGILGLNLFLHWANDPDLRPLMGHTITPDAMAGCDALRLTRAYAAIDRSNRYLEDLVTRGRDARPIDATVVDALGNGFAPSRIRGERNVGRCIFETIDVNRAREALDGYEMLLTASRWNAQWIERATGRIAHVIFEGVDPSLFCPGPRSGLMDASRFYVFSGGKIEFRKAQDLVLLAFRAFRARHPDAVLVTAWHSIWPDRAAGFKGCLDAGVTIGRNGRVDVARWAFDNGIDPDAVIDVGLVPNALLPPILREMDVALQPSRAEACTNLPVKEAMACGVPVIAALNTGMHDLLHDGNSVVLRTQRRVSRSDGAAMDDWGESDVDEIVEALEFAYRQRDEARAIGAAGRAWLLDRGRTWQAHASALKSWLLS